MESFRLDLFGRDPAMDCIIDYDCSQASRQPMSAQLGSLTLLVQ